MSIPKEPPPAKLFVSILFRGGAEKTDTPELRKALELLTGKFGPTDVLSPVLAFEFTRYYQAEMGEPLYRRVMSFETLVSREALTAIKHFCNAVESKFLDAEGQRKVNVDPGLITPESLMLATGKNFAQRIYLGSLVYAEITLLYQRKAFRPLPWTYPDYASEEMGGLLLQMRERLLAQLKTPVSS